jgi:DNA-binding Xre family transcriptional regulator
MRHHDYETIVSVAYDPLRRNLAVHFMDGDIVYLSAAHLLPAQKGARWEQATVEEGRHIHVPVDPGQGDMGGDSADIPWDTIRTLTDPQFAAEIAQAVAHNALRVGATLRTLRRQRGLTAAELGRRTGMPQQSISRIENGRHDIAFSTLERILAAMGCTLGDLQEDEADPTARVSA